MMQNRNSRGRRGQRRRIAELRSEIASVVGEQPLFGSLSGCPPEIERKFLEHVLAFEKTPLVPLFDQLVEAGVSLPPPQDLCEDDFRQVLGEVVLGLARLGVYLSSTDHLSDRQLYEQLWQDTLRVPETTMPHNPRFACHIDLIGSGSAEDIRAWLTYYASEDDRDAWQTEFPGQQLPEAKVPPFNRDRTLPRWDAIE